MKYALLYCFRDGFNVFHVGFYAYENKFSWGLSTYRKNIYFHEGYRPTFLKSFPWDLALMKTILETWWEKYFMEVAVTYYHHERSWRLTLTNMVFSWSPIHERIFTRVERHRPFSWRFWLFLWLFLALTKFPCFGSEMPDKHLYPVIFDSNARHHIYLYLIV